MTTPRLPLTPALLTLLVGAPLACATPEFRIVAKTGDAAPGLPGMVFNRFSLPPINDLGQLAISSTNDGNTDGGVWLADPVNGLSLVAARNDAFTNGPSTLTFYGLGDLDINNNATIAGHASTNVMFSNFRDEAVVILSPTLGPRLVAWEEETLPAPNDIQDFVEFEFGNLNASDQISFHAQTTGGATGNPNDSNESVWRADALSKTLVGIEGPGAYRGMNETTRINDAGAVAFPAADPAGGLPPNDSEGLWIDTPLGGTQAVVIQGDLAPGFSSIRGFGSSDSFRNFDLNALDRAAFSGFAGNSVNNTALWSEGAGNGLELVFKSGDQAPGQATGVLFTGRQSSGTGRDVRMNDAGDIIVRWLLEGPGVDTSNDSCVVVARGSANPEIIARQGDPAPDTPLGTEFGSTANRLVVADSGRVAFRTGFQEGNTGIPNAFGVYAQNASEELILVIRSGDALDLDPDPATLDVRIVANIDYSPKRPINDQDELATVITFTDDTQAVIVFDLDAPARIFVSDFDADGDVDLGDFGLFGAAFGSVAGDLHYNPVADFDADGDVDLGDFGVFGSEFGRGKP